MNTERFEQRLRDKARVLVSDTERLESEARVLGEAEVRDSTDAAISSEESAESLQEDALASKTLTQVGDALRRIADGTYGTCVVCGREIAPARLEASPWVPYCLEDQEARDQAAAARRGDPHFN